jgi:membrane fusion protein, multidrug efflux system
MKKKEMKKLFFATMVLLLASCSGRVNDKDDREAIIRQISEYKKDVIALNTKIAELEVLLEEAEGTAGAVPVSVLKVGPEPFRHYIEVSGTVEAVHSAYISPEINGVISDIHVKEGQRVSKGDLLVTISSNVIESSIREVQTSLDLAKTVYLRQKQLWDQNIGSEISYLQARNNVESLENRLETLRAQLEMSEIRAPINGIIDEVWVKKGEMAVPGVQIIQLINLDELYINADVSEAFITKIKKGEMVLVDFPSYPDISMSVPVYRVGNVIKPANRTFRVQLKISNVREQVKPNVLAKIRINDYSADQALLLPSIVIKQDLQGHFVFVVDPGNHTVNKTYIETGRSYHDKTMVTNGIAPGDLVVIQGYNQVSSGARVTMIN